MLYLGVARKEHCVKPLVCAHAPHSQLAWLPAATSTSLLHYINMKFWPHFALVFHRYPKAQTHQICRSCPQSLDSLNRFSAISSVQQLWSDHSHHDFREGVGNL